MDSIHVGQPCSPGQGMENDIEEKRAHFVSFYHLSNVSCLLDCYWVSKISMFLN